LVMGADEDMGKEWAERLTRAELEANVPCHGCGLPWFSERPMPPYDHMRDDDFVAQDEEAARFKAGPHGQCGQGRHTIEGSVTLHCWKHCPPPPPSNAVLERLVALLHLDGTD